MCGRDAELTIEYPSARRVAHRRTRSFTAVKGLSRHILARGAAVFHGPLDGCALLRGAVVPITGNSADMEYFRDREASVRRRAAARRGWQRERRWGAAPHPGLSGELLRELPDENYLQTGLFLKKCLCFSSLYEGFAIETASQIPMWDQCGKVGTNIYIYIYKFHNLLRKS